MAVVFSLLLFTTVTRLSIIQGLVLASAIVLCLTGALLAHRFARSAPSEGIAFTFFLAIPLTTLWSNLIPLALSDALLITRLVQFSPTASLERASYTRSPYIALLLGSTAAIFLTEVVDESATWMYLLEHKFEWLQTYLHTAPPLSLRALDQTHIFSVLLGLIYFLGKEESVRHSALIGLGFGLFINGAVSVIQHLYGFTDLYPNFHPFWNLEGRVAGLFTDPNSFGVSAFLCLPLIFVSFKEIPIFSRIRLPLSLFLVFSALLSGSRTFIAGGLLTGAIYLAFSFLSGRSFSKQIVGKWIGIFVITSILFLTPLILAPRYAPQAIVRSLNTFWLPSWDGGFIGKLQLLQVAIAMWLDFPVFGMGLGSFQLEFMSYVAKLQLPIGAWQDNANNFYAQLAAEKGLWGVVLFLLTLFLFRPREDRLQKSLIAQASTLAFLVTLLLGPHLNFPEVSIIFALLVSHGYEVRSQPFSAFLSFLLFAVTFISSYTTHYFADRGFYAWETAGPNHFFRWTKGSAIDWFICPSSGIYHFDMTIVHPIPQKSYTTISFSQGLDSEDVIFTDQGPHTTSVHCEAGRKASLTITSSPPWIPLLVDPVSQDVRPLGVMFKQETATSFLEKQ
jgi:O-Antigen ligase